MTFIFREQKIGSDHFLGLSFLLACHLGTSTEISIPTIPIIISETGQEKKSSKCSTVNLCTAAAMPVRPEKKKDFICRATLLKTNAIDAIGKSIL